MSSPVDLRTLPKSTFKSEQELCDYIELNIENFLKDIFEDELDVYAREYGIQHYFGPRPARVDFFIHTKRGRHMLVECKHPKGTTEQGKALSQLLTYGTLFDTLEMPITDYVLVSDNFNAVVAETISKFELPIQLVYITKTHVAYWDKQWHDQHHTQKR